MPVGKAHDNSGSAVINQTANNVSAKNLVSQAPPLTPVNTTFEWPMYHQDLTHSGFIPINVTSVQQGWTSDRLDGAVYAEPLVMGKSVFVATENNSIYSLDSQDGSINWRIHVGAPVPGESLPCGNINPSGITGTPAIDNSTHTLYAVAYMSESRTHILVGVNIDTGKLLFQRGVDPVGMDPNVQQQRGALTVANGMVYIPYGGLWGDCGDYLGWMVGVRTANSESPLFTYRVPADREAGFWATPGAVVDDNGYLYVASGNGASVVNYDHGNTLVKLSPSLQEAGSFAPADWAVLNAQDTDLGSVSPAILGHGILFQIGKSGVGYLVNSSSLGGIGGQIYRGNVCSGAFGGTAYSPPYLFVPCTDGLYMIRVNNGSFDIVWHSEQFSSGSPIVTGNDVWVVDTNSATLHVYNFQKGNEIFTTSLASVPHFVTPAAGDGRVFVVSDINRIASFILS